jgi:hypothetical protein
MAPLEAAQRMLYRLIKNRCLMREPWVQIACRSQPGAQCDHPFATSALR